MGKWATWGFGALLLAAVALLMTQVADSEESPAGPFPSVSAVPSVSVASAVAPESLPPPFDFEADEAVDGVDAGGTRLPNGEEVPGLAADAPKTVEFGVILVHYRGAQAAPKTARDRDAALALANELVVEARENFSAAVAKGDSGSQENVGKIGRGMLEPAPEYVLFSLGEGAVSDPVDTPRGFWIVKRFK